jgi:hypothetical protein
MFVQIKALLAHSQRVHGFPIGYKPASAGLDGVSQRRSRGAGFGFLDV